VIALRWNDELMTGDLAVDAGGIATDNTLATAVLLSLFTDRRARADDALPSGDNDRRGWIGDALSSVDGDLFGSRLWLLRRAKQTEETRRRAEEYAREALTWLIDENVATEVRVSAVWRARGWLGLAIAIELRQGGVGNFEFSAAAGLGDTSEAA